MSSPTQSTFLPYHIWYDILQPILQTYIHSQPHSGWFHFNQWAEDDEGLASHSEVMVNRINIRQVSRLFCELVNNFEKKDKAIVVHPTWTCHRWMKGFQNPNFPFHSAQTILINDNNFTLPKSRILTDIWLNVHSLAHLNVTINVEGYRDQARSIKNILRNNATNAMKANENTLTSVTWHTPTKHIMQVLRNLPILRQLKLKIFDNFHVPEYSSLNEPGVWTSLQSLALIVQCMPPLRKTFLNTFAEDSLPALKSIFIHGLPMNNAMVNFLTANEGLLDLAIQDSDDDPIFSTPNSDAERFVPTFHALRELSTTAHHLQKFAKSLQPSLRKLVLYGESTFTNDVFFSTLEQATQTLKSTLAFPSLRILALHNFPNNDIAFHLQPTTHRERLRYISHALKTKDIKLIDRDSESLVILPGR